MYIFFTITFLSTTWYKIYFELRFVLVQNQQTRSNYVASNLKETVLQCPIVIYLLLGTASMY